MDAINDLKTALLVSEELLSLAYQNNDPTEKEHWTKRCKYLRKAIRQLEILDTDINIPPRVFISYSKNTGNVFFKYVKKILEETTQFKVITGFDDLELDQGNINLLNHVVRKLIRSTIFLEIMTPEKNPGNNALNDFPSHWVIREEGMAVALRKPIVQWVHKEIDKRKAKIFNENLYVSLSDENYIEGAETIKIFLIKEYQRLQIEGVQ